MDGEIEFDYTIKILIIGDSNVGKTNFIHRFCDNEFNQIYMATTSVDLKSSLLEINDKKIRIQLWDTAGQEKFRSITKNLFLKVQGVLAVYDITDEKSFKNLRSWVSLIKEEYGNMPIIIVGNKNDLENQRLISKNEAISYAEEQKIDYIETSSKTGDNITKALTLIAQKILDNSEFKNDFSFTLDSSSIYNKNKRKCC